MEAVSVNSIWISLVCIVVITGVAKALNWVWLRPKKLEKMLKNQGIHGNSYRFLVGDMKDFRSMRNQAMEKPMAGFTNDYLQRVEPFRYHLMTNFGTDFVMWFGPKPTINISKPELIREVLTKMHEFRKVKSNPLVKRLFRGFVNYEGEKWAKHRKMINPAFHTEKLKIVAETGSSVVDVWPYLTTLTADVISRAAFGSSYKEGQSIFELLREQIHLALGMVQSVYIPGSSHIPTAKNRRFKKIDNQIHTLLKGVINKRKETINGEATKADLLGILMDSNSKEIQQDTSNVKNEKLGMSLQEVIDECKLFYLAGQETTSVLLVWILILLSEYQDWQARAREEVFQTFANNAPDFDGLSRLKTVTMILYEVLRLYPPATQLRRSIHKDIQLGELSLPAGASVDIQVVFVHRDKEIWGDDAEEFRPERFSEGISKATGGVVSFFPFGWGPRICIGENFALTEAKWLCR